MTRKRGLALAAAAVVVALGVVVGWYAYRGIQAKQRYDAMMADLLPEFTEPPAAGPWSPRQDAFSLRVGASSVKEAEDLMKAWGLACKDTSIRALMQARREQLAAEAKAKGVDGVSSATLTMRSPRERNPAVRLSCEKTATASLKDRPRRPAEGRLLLTFDSPSHALRHASFQHDAIHADAVRDFHAAAAFYSARFGPPTHKEGTLPAAVDLPEAATEGVVLFNKYDAVRWHWLWADLAVKLEMTCFGAWLSVSEAVEVPWPVRPDAPLRRPQATR